ncbi:MAG: protein kinase [Taibaiella sp.]|nr:protein kinase [Taibaiella sp.]
MSNIKRLQQHLKQNKTLNFAIGEVVIDTVIGQGGNGIVYFGTFSKVKMALKFLVTDATGETKQQKEKRFLAEYINVLELDNGAGIVRYINYESFMFSDSEGELVLPVIIMKFYTASITNLQAACDYASFKRLFVFLITVVEYIHNNGIIHRDIKPENILYIDNELVLADFGIASFNPEIFCIRAETRQTERIGNRLFSAPEQEDGGIMAHATMDIYAVGQVLQWFATGKTHRGTGRQSISSFFSEDVSVFDAIINKCLEQNPQNRFQAISEIHEYEDSLYEKDAYYYLQLFHDICIRNFPKNPKGILYVDDIKRIDKLFADFKDSEAKFTSHLHWWDGKGSMYFRLERISEGIWRFLSNEHVIKDIWLYYDESIFNDFILVHYEAGAPFIVGGKEIYSTGIVDEEHHISYSEYQNNWAEINGEIVDLSKHKVKQIDRDETEGYLFIGTEYSCIINYRNEEAIRNFIDKLLNGSQIETEEFLGFANTVRYHKHEKVLKNI